jgi:hypothetical protein
MEPTRIFFSRQIQIKTNGSSKNRWKRTNYVKVEFDGLLVLLHKNGTMNKLTDYQA